MDIKVISQCPIYGGICYENKRKNYNKKSQITTTIPERDSISFKGNFGGLKSMIVNFEELFGQVKNLYGTVSPKNLGSFFPREDTYERQSE